MPAFYFTPLKLQAQTSANMNSNLPWKRTIQIQDLGLIPYQQAWDYQKQLVKARLENQQLDDVLLLVEHPPVYTLGTGASLDNLKFNPDHSPWEIHRIERGGEVTYHCPGQIVSYPVLNLRYYQQDLHWYLRQLEEVIIQLLAKYRLEGYRIKGLTGVWVNEGKIAAIGIKVKRWITMHGFALNVSCDLTGFNQIVPCGIKGKSVISLVQLRPDLSLEEVKQDLIVTFTHYFSHWR
jgi:lipoyl(octanoyl) transferase